MPNAAAQRAEARFHPLADAAQWEELLRRSNSAPVVLFKHDPFCGISSEAHHQMEQLDQDVALLDVARHDPLSRAIAKQVGVRHESPQVILLRYGKAAWSASHWAITADAVRNALARHG